MAHISVHVKLWVVDGAFATFRDFESRAFAIMGRHGGRVERVTTHIAPDGSIHHGAPIDGPHETHDLTFPDQAAFDAYRSDPDLAGLANLRGTCIAKTEVTVTKVD